MPTNRRLAPIAVAVLAASVGLAACVAAPPSAVDELWIRGARVVDPATGLSERLADVVIRDGRIAEVRAPGGNPPEGARLLDGAGRFLAPGPFDCHVHVAGTPGMVEARTDEERRLVELYRDQAGRSYLLHGFTQLVDLNHASPEAIDWFGERGPAPDLLHVGSGLTMAGGYPLNFVPEADRWTYPNFLLGPGYDLSVLPESVDPASHTPEAAIERVVREGGVGVKVFWEKGFGGFTNLPTPSREMLDRIVELAGERDLPVVVHANALGAWDFVSQSGIDALVHGMWNWGDHEGAEGLPPEIAGVIDRTVGAGIALMPTTRVIGGLGELFDPTFLADERLAAVYPAEYLEWLRAGGGGEIRDEIRGETGSGPADDARMRQRMGRVRNQGDRVLRAFVQRGGELVFGSDTPSAPIYTNPPGLNGRLELDHVAELGLDPVTVARALTIAPARLFRVADDYGAVAEGRKANLVLLRSDPLESIAAWGEIVRVLVGGEVLDPAELRADRGSSTSAR